MKRIKVLYKPSVIFELVILFSLFVVGSNCLTVMGIVNHIPGLIWGGIGLCFICILFLICTYGNLLRMPKYIEVNRQQLVAHCLFQKTITLDLTIPIYNDIFSFARAERLAIVSNTPFCFPRYTIFSKGFEAPQKRDFHATQTLIFLPVDLMETVIPLSQRVQASEMQRMDTIQQQITQSPTGKHRIPLVEDSYYENLDMCIWIVVAFVVLFVIDDSFSSRLITIASILPVLFLCGILFLSQQRFSVWITLSANHFSTVLLGKMRCRVQLQQPVYFALFRCMEYELENDLYVVISNASFTYYMVTEPKKSYLSKYDQSKQVAFPYNADTAPYCDFDNWICVGGKRELELLREKSKE